MVKGSAQKQRREKKRKERERAKKKQLAIERTARRKTGSAQPDHFVVPYANSASVETIGPIVKALWSVPPAVETYLRSNGQSVPGPVLGYMLVDTGASMTCIALDVARELGLHPTGIQPGFGAGGAHANEVYHAKLTLKVTGDHPGQETVIESLRQAAGRDRSESGGFALHFHNER